MKINIVPQPISYSVQFCTQESLLTSVTHLISKSRYKPLIVTDHTLASQYASFLKDLQKKLLVNDADDEILLSFEPGEPSKTQLTVTHIHKYMVKHNYGRKSYIISIGGGLVSDIAGYAAGTYQRAVPYLNIPTTLLAMVDSCIGGKTGINLGNLKNTVGVFHHPARVFICLDFLATLPERDIFSGFAEMLKTAFIADASFISFLEKNRLDLFTLNRTKLTSALKRALRIKADLVEQDPYDTSQRRLLNYGHTFGHALESATSYALSHGEAVALGMQVAAEFSYSLVYLSKQNLQRHNHLIKEYGLPTRVPHVDPALLFEYLSHDKKTNNSHLDFVLLSSLGKAFIQPIELSIFEKFLKTFLQRTA